MPIKVSQNGPNQVFESKWNYENEGKNYIKLKGDENGVKEEKMARKNSDELSKDRKGESKAGSGKANQLNKKKKKKPQKNFLFF